MEVRCQWCGQVMETRDLRRRYHRVNKDGVYCSLEAQRERTRIRQQLYAKRNGYKPKNGTGLLGAHRHEDPVVEEYEVRKEKRRLKLVVLR